MPTSFYFGKVLWFIKAQDSHSAFFLCYDNKVGKISKLQEKNKEMRQLQTNYGVHWDSQIISGNNN